LGDRKGIPLENIMSVGYVGGDDLTGALHVLQLQSSSIILASRKSRIVAFWYWLTQVYQPENVIQAGPLKLFKSYYVHRHTHRPFALFRISEIDLTTIITINNNNYKRMIIVSTVMTGRL